MMLLLGALLAFQQPPAAPAKTCVECHREEEKEWQGSIHFRNTIGCADCHGKDAVDESKPDGQKHARGKTFSTGKVKVVNVEMCKTCHAGVFEAFKGSQHWEETQDPDAKSNGCLACHAPHATAPADRRAIQNDAKRGCANCHRKPTATQRVAMEDYCKNAEGLESEVARIRDWLAKDRPGISTKAEREVLDECVHKLKSIRTEQHGAQPPVYEKIAKGVGPQSRAAADAYSSLMGKEQEFGKRFTGLALFLGALLVNLLLMRAWLKQRSAHA